MARRKDCAPRGQALLSQSFPPVVAWQPDLVSALEPLPGFRNVLVHDYVGLDLDRVIEALDALDPVERFYDVVHGIASVD